MFSIKKGAISLILAIVLTLSLPLTAFASNIPSKIDSKTISKVNAVLNYISPQKEQFGLGDVNFSKLLIGEKISAYNYVNDELVPLNFSIFPLSINGELKAFIVYQDDGSVNITTALIKEIKNSVTANTAFALIYDKNACYAYTNNGLIWLSNMSVEDETRGTIINKNKKFDSVKLREYKAIQSINYQEDIAAQGSNNLAVNNENSSFAASAASTYISLNVSFVTQNPPSNYCWAACVASIGNYLTGYSYNARTVAQHLYGSNYNKGASMDASLACMWEMYSYAYTAHYSVPSDSTIAAALNANHPLFSGWTMGSYYHAMVIYGINAISGYISVMDPEYGFASAQANGSTYKYTSLYSGYQMSLDRYAY